jgi:hypothetical protein
VLLAGRTLAIFRSTLADEAGRIVAAHLTAALIDFRRDIRPSIDTWDAIGARVAGPAQVAWHEAVISTHRSFWHARERRELSILNALSPTPPREHQPGLFDRRADHVHQHDIEEFENAHAKGIARIEAAARAGTLHLAGPQLALLLWPRLAC